MERLSDAVQFEKEVEKDEGFDGIFPIIPTEGEIMALIDLVSEGKVRSSLCSIYSSRRRLIGSS